MIKEVLKNKEVTIVVDVHENIDKTFSYDLSKLEKYKGEINLIEIRKTFTALLEIKKEVEDLPVILFFSGDKVIYQNNNDLISASETSFYTSEYTNYKNRSFFAITRKEYVDTIVNNFLEAEICLVDLCIGGFEINNLYNVGFSEKKVVFDNTTFKYDSNGFIEVTKDNDSFENKDNGLLPIGNVLNYYYPSEDINKNYNNFVFQNNRKDIKHKTQTLKIIIYGLVSLVIVLFISKIFEYTFKYKNAAIEQEMNFNVENINRLKFLKGEEIKKEGLLKLSGSLNPNSVVYYTNEITKIVPSTIILSGLNVFPVKNKQNKTQKKNIETNLIIVKGAFTNISDFNVWVNTIQTNIKNCNLDIVKYKQNKLLETEFELKISL